LPLPCSLGLFLAKRDLAALEIQLAVESKDDRQRLTSRHFQKSPDTRDERALRFDDLQNKSKRRLGVEAGKASIEKLDPLHARPIGDARSTLVRLLRQTRPQRLIIEAPAMASTRELIRLLSDPWLAPVLDLKAVVLALDANEVFPEDEADKERLAYAAAIATMGPNEKVADAKVVEHVDLSVLDLPGPEKPKARFQSGVG